jgi:glycosyltransferase involved in cell wall biosynthesis
MEMTARHLQQHAGVSVRVCNDNKPDWDGVDVVHGCGLNRKQVREARIRGLPVLLSVIYISRAYREGVLGQTPRVEKLRRNTRKAAVMTVAAIRGSLARKIADYDRWWLETVTLFEQVDVLLPNSHLEAEQIRSDTGVTTPMTVVPNAVEPTLFGTGSRSPRNGVLFVGRIEPLKNQLRLIEALQDSGVELTIIGAEHPHHPRYAAAVRQAAARTSGVHVLGPVPHEELSQHYQRAKVHVLPSLFETTGLASLEAALCGCNVVSTDQGFAAEYLQDLAWYCNPYRTSSIRSAVQAAVAAPHDARLRERVLENYTWQHTAAATARAYRWLIDRQGSIQ